MRLFSYVVMSDTGFSPNPFWGYCTLADCKPVIRRTADVGDWIVGLTRKAYGNKIIYAMRVDEILPYTKYFLDPRFECKKPDFNRNEVVYKCGDNIYEPLENGDFRQLLSMHSNNKEEDQYLKDHDLGGRNALISSLFYYFGSQSLELPKELIELKVMRGYKNHFPEQVLNSFLEFINCQKQGVNAPPFNWSENDKSWQF